MLVSNNSNNSQPHLTIVYVADIPQNGGASKCLLELVESMTNDYDATCIVLFPTEGPLKSTLDTMGIRTVVTGHRGFLVPRPREIWKVLPKYVVEFIRYYYNRGRSIRIAESALDFSTVDIIHSNLPRTDLGLLLAARNGIPHVCHLRELSFTHFRCWSYRKKAPSFLSDGSGALIAVSHACKSAWVRRGVDDKKVAVVYDGINLEDYRCAADSTSRTTDYSNVRLLFLGGCDLSKGVLDAVDAIAKLTSEIRNRVSLDIFGWGTRGSTLFVKRRITTLGLSNHIAVHGPCDSASIIHHYDIGLVCSQNEAFGRVVIEYQAGGLAVIGPDTGSVPELLANGKQGILYEKKNGAAALSASITKLVSNPTLIQYLKKHGPSFAQQYNKATTVKRCNAIYSTLLGCHS